MAVVMGNLNARVQRAFSKAAVQYEQHAHLQRRVAEHCAGLVDPQQARVLDMGVGTGFVSRQLHNHTLIGLDISAAMLRQACSRVPRLQAVQANMQALPLADGSVDAIVSSLAIQWAENLDACLNEWRRVAASGASLVFATLLNGSLRELAEAQRQVVGAQSGNHFLTEMEITAGLAASGWRDVWLERQTYRYFFDDVWALAASLKSIGAQTRSDRSAGVFASRRYWRQLDKAYENQRSARGLPLSYEVLYVVAKN